MTGLYIYLLLHVKTRDVCNLNFVLKMQYLTTARKYSQITHDIIT